MHRKIIFAQEGSGFSNFANKNGAAIGGALSNIGQAAAGSHQLDPTSSAIKSSMTQAMGMIPGIGPMLQMASGLTSALTGALGKNLEGVTTGDKIISSIPIVGDLAGLFSGRLTHHNFDRDKVATDFAFNKEADASAIGGKNVLFGRGKKEAEIENAWKMYKKKSDITSFNERRLNNDISSNLADINSERYSGNSQSLMLAKQGIKFPELEEAKRILSLQSTKKVKEFKEGGVIGTDQSFIAKGQLHKNLHHITDNNPELEGKITKKGIPVVTMNDGGEIEQVAEVEVGEYTMNLNATKTVEDLYNQYKENPSDDILIQCGKFLVDEILKNTDDKTGLIRSIK